MKYATLLLGLAILLCGIAAAKTDDSVADWLGFGNWLAPAIQAAEAQATEPKLYVDPKRPGHIELDNGQGTDRAACVRRMYKTLGGDMVEQRKMYPTIRGSAAENMRTAKRLCDPKNFVSNPNEYGWVCSGESISREKGMGAKQRRDMLCD